MIIPAERGLTGGAARSRGAAARRRREPQELDHRIANSLQLAVDFLIFQQTRLADPAARRALIDAAERLVAVGHLHRFLCDHDARGPDVDLKPFIEELAALIGQSTGLRCIAEIEAVQVDAGLAQQLGLVLNELATNAAKHAYAPGEPGVLSIRAGRAGASLQLSVADGGEGLGRGFDMGGGGGLGFDIVHAIVRELGARLEASDDHGARFTLTVPLANPATAVSRSFAPPQG